MRYKQAWKQLANELDRSAKFALTPEVRAYSRDILKRMKELERA